MPMYLGHLQFLRDPDNYMIDDELCPADILYTMHCRPVATALVARSSIFLAFSLCCTHQAP